MSIEALSWALNLAPVPPADRGGKPNPACASVLVGLANHADPDGTGAFPSVKTLVRYTRLSERAVRTALDRLESYGVIRPCDPALIAARIKRSDRRPNGWDLALDRVRTDLDEETVQGLARQFPGLPDRVANARAEQPSDGVQEVHPVSERGAPPAGNGVHLLQERGAGGAPEPSLEPSKEPSKISTPGPLGPVQVRHARARDDAARANPEQESNETSPTRAALDVVARLPRHWRDGAPGWLLQRLADRIDRELTVGGRRALGADAIVTGVERFGDPDAVSAALGGDADGGRHLDALGAVLRTVRSEVAGGTWCRLCGPADRCGCSNRPRPRLAVVADEPDVDPLVRGEDGHCDSCGRDDCTAVVDESLPMPMAVCDTCRAQLHAS